MRGVLRALAQKGVPRQVTGGGWDWVECAHPLQTMCRRGRDPSDPLPVKFSAMSCSVTQAMWCGLHDEDRLDGESKGRSGGARAREGTRHLGGAIPWWPRGSSSHSPS